MTPVTASPDTVRAMTLDLFFDYLGVRLNGPKAAKQNLSLNFVFPDINEVLRDQTSQRCAQP